MKTIRLTALLLLVCLVCGCGEKTASASQTDATTGPAGESRESLLTFTVEEGSEEGTLVTRWVYADEDTAEFCPVLPPVPEGFPVMIGTMYEGAASALLTGTVWGDTESGTAECVLVMKGESPETVLTLMYSRDKVALLELDADMLSFCRQDEKTGLFLTVFTEDGPLSFEDAGSMLEGILEAHGMTAVYEGYGLTSDKVTDLRGNAA